jgi:hypothetical protein
LVVGNYIDVHAICCTLLCTINANTLLALCTTRTLPPGGSVEARHRHHLTTRRTFLLLALSRGHGGTGAGATSATCSGHAGPFS